MAKPVTYSKRDNEKKKQEKRVEKQKKKEERKLTGKASSFDDMIAYVDENGMITTIPPQDRVAKKVENVRFIPPTGDDSKSGTTDVKGRVEHVNAEKGYGFIKETAQTNKYFFHVSNLTESVQVGDLVLFDIERGKKGMNAVKIRKQN